MGNRRNFLGAIAVLLVGGCGSDALTPPVVPRVTPRPLPFSSAGASEQVDAIRYALELRANDAQQTFTASTTAELVATTPLRELELDFEGNVVDAAEVDGAPVPWTRRGGVLVLTLPAEVAPGTRVSARVSYHGAFPSGDGLNGNDLRSANGMFVFSPRGDRSKIYSTFSWPWGTRRWMPVRDHPRDGAEIAMRLTFPASYEVLANGERGNVTSNADGTRTWEYAIAQQMPTYDFHFAAYERWTSWEARSPRTNVPMRFFAYPNHREAGQAMFRDIPAALDFFTDFVGPYRWGTLRFHEAPNFSYGQENVTLVAIDERSFDDPEPSRRVCVHELAHHWSGNLVRIASWNDVWLSEGMTEYLTQRFIESDESPARIRSSWRNLFRMALGDEREMHGLRRAVRPVGEDASPDGLLDSITYRKGAWILRMLERRIGRDRFTAFLRGWFERHAFEAVSTDQLRTELEASGVDDLDQFFADWVSGPHHPELSVDWRYDLAARTALVRVHQRQILGPTAGFMFPYPLELELSSGSRRLRATIEIRGRVSEARVPVSFVPRTILVDPDETLYVVQQCGPRRSCRAGYRCRDGHDAAAPVCVPGRGR